MRFEGPLNEMNAMNDDISENQSEHCSTDEKENGIMNRGIAEMSFKSLDLFRGSN